MILDLAYNEMSLLRELVLKKKSDLLKSWLPKNATDEQVEKAEAMFEEPRYSDGGYGYPCLTDRHICSRLLRKFQELEDSCKTAMGIQ